MTMTLSVVIPTRNRLPSLQRLLRSLNAQTRQPREVVVVDASDLRFPLSELQGAAPSLPIKLLESEASVCVQRNIGVAGTDSDYIFICDDDIELPVDYIEKLMEEISRDSSIGAITGIVVQADEKGRDRYQFPTTSFKALLWNFLFQLSVWADLDSLQPGTAQKLPFRLMRWFYKRRENTVTLAGWPLLCRFGRPSFTTMIYGIGASIIRRDWLQQAAYDEVLDPHGIGDNYGVAIQFPGKRMITVLTEVEAYHHKIPDNRLRASESYYRRILALHYFMKRSERFNIVNRGWLVWSLLGQYLSQHFQGQAAHKKSTAAAVKTILKGKNPYWIAYKTGRRIVTPETDAG